jgi:predicted nucleotide-binding protein
MKVQKAKAIPRKAGVPKERPATYRERTSQADVPGYSLIRALKIAGAINDNYGGKPARPLQVAAAMNVQPTSGPFRMLCGASIAYGLTEGGYNAAEISLTDIARRILRPTRENDDLAAKREAVLKPRVIREFLQKYDNHPMPAANIAGNVLEEMGVPRGRTEQTLALILENAEGVGFISDVNGRKYVDLQGTKPKPLGKDEVHELELADEQEDSGEEPQSRQSTPMSTVNSGVETSRVFITHGKNLNFIEPIKKLLKFGGFEAVVAAETQSVSTPVPEKVMTEMRGCGAAIIHIDAEQRLLDSNAKEQVVLNANVLIEIGAAMALYGSRFILLVKEGITLPSNLQGLYMVKYGGEVLDSDATIKLLEAINDIKNHTIPKKS